MSEADALQDLRTLQDLIRWGASRMNEAGLHFGHGTDNALDEAAYLALHAVNLPPDTSREWLRCGLTRAERMAVLEAFRRRVQERVPAAYIANEAWFAGRPFFVDERVLIPRSPIAELIETRFTPWIEAPEHVRRVLDLGTGCGCLGIACAHAFPAAQVDLADVSEDALEVAELNVVEHGVEERVAVIQSDVFSSLGGHEYDLIVANPPYVAEDEYETLPEEYLHEPVAGLKAGPDGLDFVSRLLASVAPHLREGGLLVCEVGATWRSVVARWPNVPFLWVQFQRGGEGVFMLDDRQLRASFQPSRPAPMNPSPATPGPVVAGSAAANG